MAELTAALRAEVLAIGLNPVALVGLLLYFGQEKWKQLLARALQSDLERIRAQAQREFEAYKVSLVAEVERHKARVELNKTLAVRHAMLEYEALTALHAAVSEAVPLVLARATNTLATTAEQRREQFEVASSLVNTADAANDKAALWLSPEQRLETLNLLSRLLTIAHDHILTADAVIPEAEVEEIHQAVNRIRRDLRQRVLALTQMPD